jgi:uncharacterized protein
VFIELDRVPLEGQAVDRTIALEPQALANEEFKLSTPAAVSGHIEPLRDDEEGAAAAKGAYRFRGRMSCRIELSCVRCLEPFPMDVAEELDLLYLPQSTNVGPADENSENGQDAPGHGLEPEELAVSFYRDDRIDLSQMILEQIVLALPMKPLCKADCLGLCPQCGANRNLSSCACVIEETDPRWAPLRTLSKSRRS